MRTKASILTLLFAVCASAATVEDLRKFDTNTNGRLERDELIAYFASRGADQGTAEDAAGDALSAFGCVSDCNSLTLGEAATVADDVFKPSSGGDKALPPCKFFSIKRTVADEVDPRRKERDFPAVFSYNRNEHAEDAEDKDQFTVLGAVEALNCTQDSGKDAEFTKVVGLGLDFDVDGSTSPEESTIELAIPLSYGWVNPKDSGFFAGWLATFKPTFATDRAFDREMWGAASSFAFQSLKLGRPGFRRFIPKFDKAILHYTWQPVVLLEYSNISDPAGNADLEALDDSSFHAGLRLDFILRPTALSERLAFKFKGFQRWALEGGDSHSYTESFVTYNLDEKGTIQFTTVYRHGRKPPDFSAKDSWLIGIGINR